MGCLVNTTINQLATIKVPIEKLNLIQEFNDLSYLSLSKKISAIYRSSFRQVEEVDAKYEANFFKRAGTLASLKVCELNIASNDCAPLSAKKIINYLDDNF